MRFPLLQRGRRVGRCVASDFLPHSAIALLFRAPKLDRPYLRAYNIWMQISFDLTKDATNLAKHGVSLADAEHFEWSSALVWPDLRLDYGENRQCGLGYIGQRLFYAAFVDRDGERRIISLRKANLREIKRYAET